MKVLVCGAHGFIGRHVVHALRSAGQVVVCGVNPSQRPTDNERQIDFAQACEPDRWANALSGVDAVVNAVGVLRDSRARPMRALHADAPTALFEACARQGVRKVIHVSALGIDGNPTLYARTKLAAEAALASQVQAGRLDGVVLRPSIVFGQGGDSSQLFTALAHLPWLCLPGPVIAAQVQPIAVHELAEGIARQGMTPGQYADAVTAGLADPIRSCGARGCSSYATIVGLALIWVAAILTFAQGTSTQMAVTAHLSGCFRAAQLSE